MDEPFQSKRTPKSTPKENPASAQLPKPEVPTKKSTQRTPTPNKQAKSQTPLRKTSESNLRVVLDSFQKPRVFQSAIDPQETQPNSVKKNQEAKKPPIPRPGNQKRSNKEELVEKKPLRELQNKRNEALAAEKPTKERKNSLLGKQKEAKRPEAEKTKRSNSQSKIEELNGEKPPAILVQYKRMLASFSKHPIEQRKASTKNQKYFPLNFIQNHSFNCLA